jgi:hypothetical protein
VAELVERLCQYAYDPAIRIGALPGTELVGKPQINQWLVCFPGAKPKATKADHDRCTDSVMADVRESGEAINSGATWQGKRSIRVSVCNWKTP